MSKAKRWCFTINNYNDDIQEQVRGIANDNETGYLVYGRERGDAGTPHLQGYVIFNKRFTLNQVRNKFGCNPHLEVSRGTPSQASNYCKKDGDFEEFGDLPSDGSNGGGIASTWERYRDWLKSLDELPTVRDIIDNFPQLYGPYPNACVQMSQLLHPIRDDVEVELRPWQLELVERLEQPADDRKIIFVVDTRGNRGKSFLINRLLRTVEESQRLSVGKRDDLAHAIDPEKSLFLFDIPRGCMEYLQYPVLEHLKDGHIFSPKYQSTSKVLRKKAHVVVFSNEMPDLSKLTRDRYVLMDLDSPIREAMNNLTNNNE